MAGTSVSQVQGPADRNTFCAWSRVEDPKPNCAADVLLESTMRPMDDGAAYAPGPGTAVCRLLRSAEGFYNQGRTPVSKQSG